MSWTERFADKVLSLEEAALLIRSGDRVMAGLPEPEELLSAIGARTDLADVTLYVPAPRAGGVDAALNAGIELHAPFVTQLARDRNAEIEVLPVHFSGMPAHVRRWQPRVAIVLVGEPEDDGTVPPGAVIAVDDVLVRRPKNPGDIVIGMVSANQPRVQGHTFSVEDFDVLVPLPADAGNPVHDDRNDPALLDAFIGPMSDLIPDGATIQAGVGGLSEALMYHLDHKRDLGIHTEVIGAGMVHLIESGVATNRAKTHYPGETLFTIALPEVYDFVDRNPSVRIEPASIVLDPREIAKNHKMRCINSVLQVDLFGQANAEMIDGVQFSGVGGQLDFHRACQLADDALSILVLQSTAARGTASRIVPRVDPNAVTATRYDTQVVVTEHGVAWLRDATMRQKAERLIAIAHPDFRSQLTDDAKAMGLM